MVAGEHGEAPWRPMTTPHDEAACLATLRPLVERVRTDVTAVKRKAGGSVWTTEALTPSALRRHLNGGPARGVCPIKAGEDTTAVAVLDLDSHRGETPWASMAEVAARVVQHATTRGVTLHPFASSGGRGVHLIALWDTPQDARSVRHLMADILAGCGLRSGAKGVAAGDVEVFPKQDSVPADGFGNQFILPLAGESVPLEPMAGMARLPRGAAVLWQASAPVPPAPAPAPRTLLDHDALPADLAELRDALDAIPNSGDDELGYDEWLRVVFAVHEATRGSEEGYALAEDFSARSSRHNPEFLRRNAWNAARDDRPTIVTARTLFALARDYGWQRPTADDLGADPPAPEPATTPAPAPLKFAVEPAATFAQRPPPSWIVRGVVPRADLMVIYGESGAGKSFAALDLCMSIARGEPWRDLRTRAVPVVYVVAEGSGGFRARLLAYAQHHEVDLAGIPFGIVHTPPNMLEPGDARQLIKAVNAWGPCGVVVLDTLAQAMPGGNENAGEDLGKVLAHCRALRRATGALVILVHHSGKDASKGARGWSGLRAAADAEIEVLRVGTGRVIRVRKQKDGDDSGEWGFDLAPRVVGVDDEGEEVSSMVVVPAALPAPDPTAGPKRGKVETLVLAVIVEIGDVQRTGIEVSAVVAEAVRRMPDPEDGRRDRRPELARRALTRLLHDPELGLTREEDGTLTLD